MRLTILFLVLSIALTVGIDRLTAAPACHDNPAPWGYTRIDTRNCPLYYPREEPWWVEQEKALYHPD
ncbi:hypothetical protein GGQ74_001488 [Desulfobaculum xiamenense]|uniref:Uncharacterized protein n=1 Tax=Desulfobaculum xiamenense TaxID=995050 RepID=A0A846QHW5_9BACT|nr:hypothetical protein [Desulfobaculum xiamenense]NJB67848.1 hypothetical protein [Desulfobaculum xiamenense]